jgi:hypothetical protein
MKFDGYKEWSLQNVPATDGKSWQTVKEVINVWCWRRESNPPYQPVKGYTEVFGSALLEPSGKYIYTGILDALVHETMGYAVEETKFSRSKIQGYDGKSEWLENFNFDTQITGEIYLAKHAWPQLNIHTVYVNGLECRKPVGMGTKTKKCAKHKVPYEECRTRHIDTVVQGYHKTEEELQKFQYWALEDARKYEQLKKDYPDLGAAHLLPQEGMKKPFSNCQRCEFKQLCRGPIDGRYVEAATQHVEWGPAVGKPAWGT